MKTTMRRPKTTYIMSIGPATLADPPRKKAGALLRADGGRLLDLN